MTSTDLKSCGECGRVLPRASFYRNCTYCDPCRQEHRKRWKAKNWSHTAVTKLQNRGRWDPTAYGQLHCEHIAVYTKRAIDRFESRTGNEAPPELGAIHQLAMRMSESQHAHLIARGIGKLGSRDPKHRVGTIIRDECRSCGEQFEYPWQRQARSYCSSRCKQRQKTLRKRERATATA